MEKRAAIAARNRLAQLVTNCDIQMDDSKEQLSLKMNQNTFIVEIKCGKWDKYGRLLTNIRTKQVDDVSETLIKEGHGYLYNGGKKKSS